jgi:hypothetical protein
MSAIVRYATVKTANHKGRLDLVVPVHEDDQPRLLIPSRLGRNSFQFRSAAGAARIAVEGSGPGAIELAHSLLV